MDQFRSKSATETGEYLKQLFLKGTGTVTQLPGQPAPETRKFYATHKGTDIGTASGTAVTPNFAGVLKNLGSQGGYGNRVAIYNPQEDKTYLLSHLNGMVGPEGSFQPGAVVAQTGNTGWSTGPHVDIESYAGGFDNVLKSIRQSVQMASSKTLPKLNLQAAFDNARKQYGNLKAVSTNPEKLMALAKQHGGKVFKL